MALSDDWHTVAVRAQEAEARAAAARDKARAELLTKRDITFDPTQGWKAYPDFAEHFAQLWGAA